MYRAITGSDLAYGKVRSWTKWDRNCTLRAGNMLTRAACHMCPFKLELICVPLHFVAGGGTVRNHWITIILMLYRQSFVLLDPLGVSCLKPEL